MNSKRPLVLVTQDHLEAKELKATLSRIFDVKIVFVYDDTYLEELERRLTPISLIYLTPADSELAESIRERYANQIIGESNIQISPHPNLIGREFPIGNPERNSFRLEGKESKL